MQVVQPVPTVDYGKLLLQGLNAYSGVKQEQQRAQEYEQEKHVQKEKEQVYMASALYEKTPEERLSYLEQYYNDAKKNGNQDGMEMAYNLQRHLDDSTPEEGQKFIHFLVSKGFARNWLKKPEPPKQPDPAKEQARKFAQTSQLRQHFNSNKVVLEYNTVSRMYNNIMSSDDTAQGDITLIYSFLKLLDPNSAVLPGEYKTASNTGGLADNLRQALKKAQTGDKLLPKFRKNFRNQAAKIYAYAKKRYDATYKQYVSIAAKQGYGSDIFTTTDGINQPTHDHPISNISFSDFWKLPEAVQNEMWKKMSPEQRQDLARQRNEFEKNQGAQ